MSSAAAKRGREPQIQIPEGQGSPSVRQRVEEHSIPQGDHVNYDEREQIYRNLWHSDVKKDHGADSYDSGIVQSLLPDRYEPPSSTIPKDVLFSTIVSDFVQWPEVNASGTCTVSCISADYEYEVFPLHKEGDRNSLTTISGRINKFLEHLQIVKITDTTVHGAELLPYLENVKQAHTRETEYDPVGKMNPNSATADKREEFKNKFYIEIGGGGINPHGLQYLPYNDDTKGTISELYTNKDIMLNNNGIKNKKTGTLDVSFSYENSDRITRTIVPEKANIAKVLENVEEFLQGLFGKGTPSTKRKEIVFLSKHFGDIGQVLTRYRDIALTPFKNIDSAKINRESDIRTCNYALAFESFDLNAISKAFAVGTEIIWYYPPAKAGLVDDTDKKVNYDRMIIFKRQRNLSIQEKIEKLTTKLGGQLQSLQGQIDHFHTQAQALNNRKQKFHEKWEEYIQSNGIGRASSSSSSSSPALPQPSEDINDRQKAYTTILQTCLQFAYFSNFVSKEHIQDITIKDVENSMELLYENLRQLALRFREVQYLHTEIFDGANLKPVKLEQDIIIACSSHVGDKIRLEKKPSITDCWSRLNFKDDGKANKGSTYEGRVLVGSPYLASWAFELVIHIYNNLSNYNVKYADTFLTMLHNVLNETEQKIFEDLILVCIRNEEIQGTLSGGATLYSSILHTQKGGNPITENVEILATILEDILHYFTFIHAILQGKGDYAKYIQKYLTDPIEGVKEGSKELPLPIEDEFRIDFNELLSKDGFLSTFSLFPIYQDLIDTIENNPLIPANSKTILVDIRKKLDEIYEYDTIDLTDIVKPAQAAQGAQAEAAQAAAPSKSNSEGEGNRSNVGSIAGPAASASASARSFPFGSPVSQVATLAHEFSPQSSISNESGSAPGSAAQAEKIRGPKPGSLIGTKLNFNTTKGGYRNAKTYKKKKHAKNESAKRRKSM